MLHRVLRRDYQKRLGQRIGMSVHRNLTFVHGFEQRGLSLGRGAIDFVGQKDIRKDRAAFEFKLLLDGRVNGNSQHVRGQHVAGELHSLESAIESSGQSLPESGFAHARDTFNQQVAARQDRDQSKA